MRLTQEKTLFMQLGELSAEFAGSYLASVTQERVDVQERGCAASMLPSARKEVNCRAMRYTRIAIVPSIADKLILSFLRPTSSRIRSLWARTDAVPVHDEFLGFEKRANDSCI